MWVLPIDSVSSQGWLMVWSALVWCHGLCALTVWGVGVVLVQIDGTFWWCCLLLWCVLLVVVCNVGV